MTRDEKLCRHPKADSGEPCQSFASCDECGRCWAHCKHNEEERAAARKKGGHATAQRRSEDEQVVPPGDAPAAPETLEDAVRWASWASLQVATGKLDTSRANSVARLLSEFRKLLEKSESREALEKVEEMRRKLEGADADLEVVE